MQAVTGSQRTPPTVYRLVDGVLSVDADDETILLAVDGGRYHGVKGAIRALMEPLRDGLTLAEMVARTCARFDVSEEDARADLARILAELETASLVTAAAD